MIVGFKSEEARRIFAGLVSRHLPPDIQTVARRKLRYLDAAVRLEDLRVPPGNRLEALRGSRGGQHSIRINDQWRICFVWLAPAGAGSDADAENDDGEAEAGGSATDVEIVDYH